MKRIFLLGAILLALSNSHAATVVYEGPVVYQAPAIYYGPVIYQAAVIYQLACNPFFNPAICPWEADSPAVIYTGRGWRGEDAVPNCPSSPVIFFGHEQARRQGYQFTRPR